MKRLAIMTILGLSLIHCLSCRNNRLKINEKELVKEILDQEKEKNETERTASEKESSKTIDNPSGSFREKEIRSVDSKRPPVILDILGTRGNTLKFKLSDIASSIRYVKLQVPSDTILLYDPFYNRSSLTSSIKSDDGQIIFQGLFGVTRFNMQGGYEETIWKNERGIDMGVQGVGWRVHDFYGVMPNNPVSILNGNVYYSFTDGPAGTGQFMKYKPGTIRNMSVQSQSEVPGLGSVQGDTLLITQKNPLERFDWLYGVGSDTWVGINQKWSAGKSGSLLVTYNAKGDTLCQFTDFDRIVNFDQPQYRNAVEFTSYYYDGLLTIKQDYNDTVFRLIPPNRLLPAYIIDFGKFKVNFMEGLDPNFDLSGKYMLYSLYETNDFLLIRYTQNYDCPNNRKKNAVKFYNALFSKKQKKIYHQSGFTLLPEDIINDLDGGISFWPDFVTPQGEMIKLVSGKNMKDYVSSDKFKNAAISEEMRQKQISLTAGLRPTDMILIFVK
jgi:hypothetical protein